MSKLFLALFFPIFAFSFSWDYTHEFNLKKDEVAKIKVLKREDSSVRFIDLRWTLYRDDTLVLLVNYDGFPTQYILQQKHKRNSIKMYLQDDYVDGFKRAYLIVSFKDMNLKKAKLVVNITDVKKVFKIEFIDPKK
jgi:hypothetical protein